MEKCDVCSKTTLLPEKMGDTIICKKCLLKINGLMWKYRNFEKNSDLEKTRQKVLELANKNNFPDNVLIGINKYFNEQKNRMVKCDACSEVVLSTEKLGDAIICKKCFSKINTSEWKNKDYFDHDELNKEKDKVIKIAKNNNFPETAIKYIEEYFSKKVAKNWLYTIDGEVGQILKIYDDYLVITTTDEFNEDEILEKYKKLLYGDRITKEEINEFKDVGQMLLNDLFGRKNPFRSNSLLKTAANYATDKIVNVSNKDSEFQDNFNIQEGNLKIYYKDYDYINFIKPKKEALLGVLIIRNMEKSQHGARDILFFIENDDIIIEKINKAYPFLENKLINKVKDEDKKVYSVADELRELKSLLDEGIITEDDFEQKKKDLLKLK